MTLKMCFYCSHANGVTTIRRETFKQTETLEKIVSGLPQACDYVKQGFSICHTSTSHHQYTLKNNYACSTAVNTRQSKTHETTKYNLQIIM